MEPLNKAATPRKEVREGRSFNPDEFYAKDQDGADVAADWQDRSPDFLRLANALSALYPAGSEEKHLLDAMLLAVPR